MSMQGCTKGAGYRQGWLCLSLGGYTGETGREKAGRNMLFTLTLLGLHTTHCFSRLARNLAFLSNLVEKVADLCLTPTSCKRQRGLRVSAPCSSLNDGCLKLSLEVTTPLCCLLLASQRVRQCAWMSQASPEPHCPDEAVHWL